MLNKANKTFYLENTFGAVPTFLSPSLKFELMNGVDYVLYCITSETI